MKYVAGAAHKGVPVFGALKPSRKVTTLRRWCHAKRHYSRSNLF